MSNPFLVVVTPCLPALRWQTPFWWLQPLPTCTEVMDPFLVVVMRSCRSPRSVASVGWYPTAEGMRPSSADTSELA